MVLKEIPGVVCCAVETKSWHFLESVSYSLQDVENVGSLCPTLLFCAADPDDEIGDSPLCHSIQDGMN